MAFPLSATTLRWEEEQGQASLRPHAGCFEGVMDSILAVCGILFLKENKCF